MKSEIDYAKKRARITNGLISLEMDFSNGLRLAHLRNLATGTDWIPQPPDYQWGTDDFLPHLVMGGREGLWPDLAPPSSEFVMRCAEVPETASLNVVEFNGGDGPANGRVFDGLADARVVGGRSFARVDGGRAELAVTVEFPDCPVQVTVHTEVRAGVAVARRWATATNTGEHPAKLQQLTSLLLSVRPGPGDLDFQWVESFVHPTSDKVFRWRLGSVHRERLTASTRRKLRSGTYSREHDGVHGSAGWMALHDPSLREGMFVGWEWSGLFDVEVGDFREGAGVFGIRAEVSREGGYERLLAPGESFGTPATFVGFYAGDAEMAGRETRRAAEKLFGLPWPEGKAPAFIGYCTWSNWQDFSGVTQHLKPERLGPEIGRAKELGVELFIVDFDWFPVLGDFRSDPDRFPDGIEAISRQVKAAGMKFGLWMGFGQAHESAPVVREHPEWLVSRGGEVMVGGWGLRSLCLGYPPCRDWVLEQICRVIETFGVDWLKHDFDLIPVSDAHHHAPSATDSRIESVAGYYHIMDKVRERFPHLYLDNWTPALGGADFGNFRRHHSTMMCDFYGSINQRSMWNGLINLFPPERMHTYVRGFSRADERSPYTFRSAAFGNGMCLLNDILQWDGETMRIACGEIAHIKADRDLFRGGEIHALIDKQPDHYGWDARLVVGDGRHRAMAQVFRNHDPRSEHTVVFRGLDPGADYDVRWVDADRSACAKGCDLMTAGVKVVLPQPFSSEIIRLEARSADFQKPD
jgi:hypothetical protein